VLCLGLLLNVVRFLYIGWLKSPWWVLPFEFLQGITHATVWAACCSYIAHNTPVDLRPSANGVLGCIHHGIGRACGAIIGGIFITYFGTPVVFRAYGFLCLLILAFFIFINFFKEGKWQTDLTEHEDPREVAEASHLAPHGVPTNPMPRALSSSKLNEVHDQGNFYQNPQQGSGMNLNPPNQAGYGA
ncbi:unnamed protein product, partial [Darwinula stevensoni]